MYNANYDRVATKNCKYAKSRCKSRCKQRPGDKSIFNGIEKIKVYQKLTIKASFDGMARSFLFHCNAFVDFEQINRIAPVF